MKKFSLVIVAMLAACGGTSPLVPVHQEAETEAVVPSEDAGTLVIVIPPVKALEVEQPQEVDSGTPEVGDVALNFPGNSENAPRCDAGRGKKLGLIKHGKCEPQ